MVSPIYIGIDVGTSGCRAMAIDHGGTVLAEAREPIPAPLTSAKGDVEQNPDFWWAAVTVVLDRMASQVDGSAVRALALDGTSGTVLLTRPDGSPLGPALMYNDARSGAEARRLDAVAPPESAAHGTGSGLAKALWLAEAHSERPVRLYTQADWLNWRLCGRWFSDANNSLKNGYDPVRNRWPEWLDRLGIDPEWLPPVLPPGTVAAPLLPALAERWRFPACRVVSGTTDSTAAILATGVSQPGDAVTSLGSTLVTKVVSTQPVSAPEYGVYSQPFGDFWLAGGGSNSGGVVLRHFFSDARMAELTPRLEPDRPTGLDYYPLTAPGERFPVNDPALSPRIEPRPDEDVRFFQGLLEGMAAIEKAGYERLAALGAPRPSRVLTTGGGAVNEGWRKIRERVLGIPVKRDDRVEAAYGVALLAARPFSQSPHG